MSKQKNDGIVFVLVGLILIILFSAILIVRGMHGFDGNNALGFGPLEVFVRVPLYAASLIGGVILLGKGIEKIVQSKKQIQPTSSKAGMENKLKIERIIKTALILLIAAMLLFSVLSVISVYTTGTGLI